MTDKISGYLEVGTNDKFEVVVNLDKDRNGIGHIVFSPGQAEHLAGCLQRQAKIARAEYAKHGEQPIGKAVCK